MEMRKKESTFRGMTLEELKKLDVREFSKLIKSRQRRTTLRNFQEIENFVKKALKKNERGKKIRTHKRDLIIVPKLIGLGIQVYNGKEFVPFQVTQEMLGHKLGEFSPTRTRTKHTKSGVGATKGSRALSKK
jgi:small subunit ribosomal protein S19